MARKMNLLEAGKNVTEDFSLIDSIMSCMNDRMIWLEEKEPESEGQTYDNWEEKKNAFEEVLDLYEEAQGLIETIETEEDKEDAIEKLKEADEALTNFQYEYGGLSRLKID